MHIADKNAANNPKYNVLDVLTAGSKLINKIPTNPRQPLKNLL